MKFLDKYELIEQVTNGVVESFVGRELTSGDRVLVHIFAGSDSPAGQDPRQWALQSFRNLAPAPLGSVIDGGRYLQAPGAFLVTSFSDMAALTAWARLYKSQFEKTQELSGPDAHLSGSGEEKGTPLPSRSDSGTAVKHAQPIPAKAPSREVAGLRQGLSRDEPTRVFTSSEIPAATTTSSPRTASSEPAQISSRPSTANTESTERPQARSPATATRPTMPPRPILDERAHGSSTPSSTSQRTPAEIPQTVDMPSWGELLTAPAPEVPPPISYWPLILVMNVLLLAAVGLVLYFAFKK